MAYVIPVDMRERRQAKCMTQEDVAKRLHITRIHANRIENGARPLTLEIALDLVDLFDELTIRRDGRDYVILPAEDAVRESAVDEQAVVPRAGANDAEPTPRAFAAWRLQGLLSMLAGPDLSESMARLGVRP